MYILDIAKTACAGLMIPNKLINIVHVVILFIEIAVPVVLIIYGMIDFGKAVMAQKEDEIKKNQKLFLKRLLAAGIVFFVIAIVNLLFNLVEPNDPNGIWKCVEHFVSGVK